MGIKITTISRLAVLLELLKGPQHGYHLMKAVAARIGSPCSPAQIYPFLSQLEKQKMVVGRADGTRERQAYSLTPAGRKFVQDALSRMGQMMDLAVAGRVSQCAHCSCRIYGQAVIAIAGRVKLPYCCPHCAKHAGAKIIKPEGNP